MEVEIVSVDGTPGPWEGRHENNFEDFLWTVPERVSMFLTPVGSVRRTQSAVNIHKFRPDASLWFFQGHAQREITSTGVLTPITKSQPRKPKPRFQTLPVPGSGKRGSGLCFNVRPSLFPGAMIMNQQVNRRWALRAFAASLA